ncbi:MAG: GntR family transcriptional regulator [Chloroflexi bacterium]|nr:MAG: GntR family transcriptional regulator [Chloroflexota bacterium]
MTVQGTLAPITNQNTLADIVTARLREAIIQGKLKPGERLAEPSLAAELGVSRSPVREALVRLESERLVSRQANRGFFVWEPKEKDVDEILSLRVMMESLAAELVLANLTDEDFDRLEEIYQTQKKLVELGEFLRLTREDRHFHDYCVVRSGNSRLVNMWGQIMSQWEVLIYRRIERFPTVSKTVLSDHRLILDTMKQKDLKKVVELHRTINARVGQEMKDALRQALI